MPKRTRIIADNFKIGAELGFALRDPDIAVLDHPLNHKHGRAPQLRLWGLQRDMEPGAGPPDWASSPALLVVGISDVPYKHLLQRYHELCGMVGPLPPPHVINVDRGRRRFALFALDRNRDGACTTPAMAWIDEPAAGARIGRNHTVKGWAFKDGVGLSKVEVLLDGEVVATAAYGGDYEGLTKSWPGTNDPNHPRVAFEARMDLPENRIGPGRHWLGLRLHGRDGSVEDWAEQPVELR